MYLPSKCFNIDNSNVELCVIYVICVLRRPNTVQREVGNIGPPKSYAFASRLLLKNFLKLKLNPVAYI